MGNRVRMDKTAAVILGSAKLQMMKRAGIDQVNKTDATTAGKLGASETLRRIAEWANNNPEIVGAGAGGVLGGGLGGLIGGVKGLAVGGLGGAALGAGGGLAYRLTAQDKVGDRIATWKDMQRAVRLMKDQAAAEGVELDDSRALQYLVNANKEAVGNMTKGHDIPLIGRFIGKDEKDARKAVREGYAKLRDNPRVNDEMMSQPWSRPEEQ